jgi:hypothetical protein
MKSVVDDAKFMRDMKNIMDYSIGFMDGVGRGKTQFLENLGKSSIEAIKDYIDSMARVDNQMLHHVYEWSQTGSPDARLFDINYVAKQNGLSMSYTFRQSSSIKNGSNVPFYDKARIMEEGIPVTIKPKTASVLAFEDNGEKVFTKNPISIDSPGGSMVAGSFEKTFDRFFQVYFSQVFLHSSGIIDYLKNPTVFKRNLSAGKSGGRSTGLSTGYRWIANAGVVR